MRLTVSGNVVQEGWGRGGSSAEDLMEWNPEIVLPSVHCRRKD